MNGDRDIDPRGDSPPRGYRGRGRGEYRGRGRGDFRGRGRGGFDRGRGRGSYRGGYDRFNDRYEVI